MVTVLLEILQVVILFISAQVPLLAASLVRIPVTVLTGDSFGYDPKDHLGPEKWSQEYKECAGKYQSPINIDESLVTRVRLPSLRFSGIRELPWTASLQNNGHTVLLKINGTEPILISGGPLTSTYRFEQLHFHWGANDSAGSEDLINDKSFPMELHQVYFNTKYRTFTNALKHKDGLVVLATFFELSNADNRAYAELVDALKEITMPNNVTMLPYLLPLEYLLPTDRQRYFTYNGSLTTPPCLEVVTWIEFKHPVLVSPNQLKEFRQLHSESGLLTHNARPIQPLHGRKVLYNYEDLNSNAQNVKCSVLTINIILLLLYGCNY